MRVLARWHRRDAIRVTKLAEDLGYKSLWTGAHMALPGPAGTVLAAATEASFLRSDGGDIYLAAHTTSIKLRLGIVILPQRHPVQLAKELATLDILSDCRLLVGMASATSRRSTGPLAPTRDGSSPPQRVARGLCVLWTADITLRT